MVDTVQIDKARASRPSRFFRLMWGAGVGNLGIAGYEIIDTPLLPPGLGRFVFLGLVASELMLLGHRALNP